MKFLLITLVIELTFLNNSYAENSKTIQFQSSKKIINANIFYNSEKNLDTTKSYRYNSTFHSSKKVCVRSDDESFLQVYAENGQTLGKIQVDDKFLSIKPMVTEYLLISYDDDDDDDGLRKKLSVYDNDLNVKQTSTFIGGDLAVSNDFKYAAVAYSQAPIGAGLLKVINTETLEDVDLTTIVPVGQPFLSEFTNKNELIVITPEPKSGKLITRLINITDKSILRESVVKSNDSVSLSSVKSQINKSPDGYNFAFLAVNKNKRISGERNLPNTIYTIDGELNSEEILVDGIVNDVRYLSNDLLLISKWQLPSKANNFNKDSKLLIYDIKTKKSISESPFNGTNLLDVLVTDGEAYCYFESKKGNDFANAYKIALSTGVIEEYKNSKLPLAFIGNKKIVKNLNTNKTFVE